MASQESPEAARRDVDAPPPDRPRRQRVALVDMARGVAICGMVLFHLNWDLAYWGWQDTFPTQSTAWRVFGHAVAATFLFLSGVCLVLARPKGVRPALRRIALLGVIAALITAVTWWLFPGEVIVFGIIHCVALAGLIGLALLRAPVSALLGVGAASALAPLVLTLDSPIGRILGLSTSVPVTLDYRPLLPWLAAMLIGMAAARTRLAPRSAAMPGRWSAPLVWAGRRSLVIYLVHQPILFGLFWLAAAIHPASLAQEQAAFTRQCRTQCVAAGSGAAGCMAACACVLGQLHHPLEIGSELSPRTPEDLRSASETCLRSAPAH